MSRVLEATGLEIGYSLPGGVETRVAQMESIAVEGGEMVCLLGPNGVGKSTLLRTLAGLQRPLAGSLRLLGGDFEALGALERARRVAVVLTDPVDAGALVARDLVALGRHPYTGWLGRLSPTDRGRVDEALAAVGATHLAGKELRSMSDGERQRVLIARALAQDPRLMVLDEPTAFLDLPSRIQVTGLLHRVVAETGIAVVLATHHLELALEYADRVWLLDREGRLAAGAPEDVALGGLLERTFASEGVVFDPHDGSFRLEHAAGDGLPVTLEASGLVGEWTERALRRAGYAVARGATGAMMRVTASGEPGFATWELEADGVRTSCGSLLELVAALRAASQRTSARSA